MSTIIEHIEKLLAGDNLSFDQSAALLDTIFEGKVPEPQIAAFLTAMRMKGETSEELAGLARSLRNNAVSIDVGVEHLVDTCGTGGAAIKTFNISTAAAFVAAGAGVYVAKHGNRGITSKCGSADVLEALGVKIDPTPDVVAGCIRQAHIGFMFAPMFHPAMKYVQPVRKGLGFRTVFNILGPLANPAGAEAQVMGVADEALMELVINALDIIGIRRAMVVHSDGLDEISTMGETKILKLKDGHVTAITLNPLKHGIKKANLEDLKGGDAATNAGIVRDILSGKDNGARKDIVVLNAAAAIVVGGLADDFNRAIDMAETSISDGGAARCLEKMIELSNS